MTFVIIVFFSVLGGMIQTLTGFGAGVVLMMAASRLFDMLTAPALTSVVCWAIAASLLFRNRKALELKKAAIPIVTYTCFSVLSIRIAGNIDLVIIKILFGVFLIALCFYLLFGSKRTLLRPTNGTAVFVGSFSGVCSGLFGIGGPLLAVYFAQVTDDRSSYIADLQSVFVLNGLISNAVRIMHGYYTVSLIPLTLIGIASMLVGKYFGQKIADRIDADTLKKIVYVFVGISGIVTILETVL